MDYCSFEWYDDDDWMYGDDDDDLKPEPCIWSWEEEKQWMLSRQGEYAMFWRHAAEDESTPLVSLNVKDGRAWIEITDPEAIFRF